MDEEISLDTLGNLDSLDNTQAAQEQLTKEQVRQHVMDLASPDLINDSVWKFRPAHVSDVSEGVDHNGRESVIYTIRRTDNNNTIQLIVNKPETDNPSGEFHVTLKHSDYKNKTDSKGNQDESIDVLEEEIDWNIKPHTPREGANGTESWQLHEGDEVKVSMAGRQRKRHDLELAGSGVHPLKPREVEHVSNVAGLIRLYDSINHAIPPNDVRVPPKVSIVSPVH